MNERIRFIREDLGLTRAEFGEKIGVSKNVINNWERGRAPVKPVFLHIMVSEFSLNLDWLIDGTGKPYKGKYSTFTDAVRDFYSDASDFEIQLINAYLSLSKEERDIIWGRFIKEFL